MTKMYCDRCKEELKAGEQSAHVNIVGDADPDGNGKVTGQADLCLNCHDALISWVTHHESWRFEE